MKLLVLSVVALLMASGEALTCHRCVPSVAGGNCQRSAETCGPGKDTCIAAKFLMEPFGYFQRCIAMSDCQILQQNSYISITCCDSDFCNSF